MLARVMSQGLVSFLSTRVNPVFLALDLDWRAFAFTAGVAALTSILLGSRRRSAPRGFRWARS